MRHFFRCGFLALLLLPFLFNDSPAQLGHFGLPGERINALAWEFYYPDLSGDNACDAIATVANYPDMLYAGMEGAVIKTTDSGQNWEITALQNTPYYFYGIVANPENPNHVIAGGVSNQRFETFERLVQTKEVS